MYIFGSSKSSADPLHRSGSPNTCVLRQKHGSSATCCTVLSSLDETDCCFTVHCSCLFPFMLVVCSRMKILDIKSDQSTTTIFITILQLLCWVHFSCSFTINSSPAEKKTSTPWWRSNSCSMDKDDNIALVASSSARYQQQQRRRLCFKPNHLYDPSMVALHMTRTEGDSNLEDLKFDLLYPETLVSAKCLIEQTLCQPTDTGPQLAKDVDYASSILEAWKAEEEESDGRMMDMDIEWASVTYYDETNGVENKKSRDNNPPLYGHIVRQWPTNIKQSSSSTTTKAIGIVLFHTGAGPHDIFLLWKASSLIRRLKKSTLTNDNEDGVSVTVLIADILSDDIGWAWDTADRTKYNQVRSNVLETSGTNDDSSTINRQQRPILQSRIRAAIQTLENHIHESYNVVDSTSSTTEDIKINIAAMGWCLGGHSILELGRMTSSSSSSSSTTITDNEDNKNKQIVKNVRALVTFHGVFDGIEPPSTCTLEDDADNMKGFDDHNDDDDNKQIKVLICNGKDDPFVTKNILSHAMKTFEYYGHHVALLSLDNTKHGYTNPGQEYNDNVNFEYNDESAIESWNLAMTVIEETCCD